MRSPWGRVLKAIREDEDAVRCLGKNVYAYKMQSLIIGGVLGGLGGSSTRLRSAAIGRTSSAPTSTFFAYTVLILGGAARVLGPVVGAMIFWFLLTFLDDILQPGHVRRRPADPGLDHDRQPGRPDAVHPRGLGLMLLMIFRPQGIFGDRREIALDAR